jgi:hypothetical protein
MASRERRNGGSKDLAQPAAQTYPQAVVVMANGAGMYQGRNQQAIKGGVSPLQLPMHLRAAMLRNPPTVLAGTRKVPLDAMRLTALDQLLSCRTPPVVLRRWDAQQMNA